MKTVQFLISGEAPLLMHSAAAVDPCSSISQRMKAVSSKRAKTLEDHQALKLLEIEASLYRDKAGIVSLPTHAMEACVIGAAKTRKLGAPLKRAGFTILGEYSPLTDKNGEAFDFTLDDILEDKEKWFSVPVVVSNARIIRTRPRFDDWGGLFTATFNDEVVNPAEFESLLHIAGAQIGLCDWRPKFGKFSVEVIA